MRGQPGVYDVIKTVRRSPFGEWNIVYYDATKTTLADLQQQLRARGCPRATHIAGEPVGSKRTLLVRAANPLLAPGDLLQVQVELKAASGADRGTVYVTLPKGWTLPGKRPATRGGPVVVPLSLGVNHFLLQTPKKARRGALKVHLEAQYPGSARRRLDVPVELVSQVR